MAEIKFTRGNYHCYRHSILSNFIYYIVLLVCHFLPLHLTSLTFYRSQFKAMALNGTPHGTFEHGGPQVSANSGNPQENERNQDRGTNVTDGDIFTNKYWK